MMLSMPLFTYMLELNDGHTHLNPSKTTTTICIPLIMFCSITPLISSSSGGRECLGSATTNRKREREKFLFLQLLRSTRHSPPLGTTTQHSHKAQKQHCQQCHSHSLSLSFVARRKNHPQTLATASPKIHFVKCTSIFFHHLFIYLTPFSFPILSPFTSFKIVILFNSFLILKNYFYTNI